MLVSRCLFLVALVLPHGAGAQATSPPTDTTGMPGAPVVLAGDTLLRIYAPLGAQSPAERATALAERLLRLERDTSVSGDSVVVRRTGDALLISIGDRPLMSVLPADAAAAGVPIDSLAGQYRSTLAVHFAAGSGTFRLKALLEAIGFALFATLVLVVLAWLLRRLLTRLEALVDRLRHAARLSIRFQKLELISAHQIADVGLAALRVVRIAVWVVLGYFYVVLVLSLFPWTHTLSTEILGYVLAPLGAVGRSVLAYLPNLFFLALIIIATRWVLQLIHFVFRAIGNGAITINGFERDWAEPTYKLVRVLVMAFALVVLWPYLPGSGSDAFKGVSIFVGVLFSLGSTGAVSNLVAGTLLTYTRSFQIGDRVRIGETLGDVVARTLLVTRVRTLTNVEVTIPNSQVMSGQVLNFSTMAAESGVALQVKITIGYDVPWRRVHELLLEAALAAEGVAETPAPFVLQVGLDDSYPCYELNAYTRDAAGMRFALSALHAAVQDAFARGRVEITSPAYLAVRKGDASTIPEVPTA